MEQAKKIVREAVDRSWQEVRRGRRNWKGKNGTVRELDEDLIPKGICWA
jgi:hypothetical protein